MKKLTLTLLYLGLFCSALIPHAHGATAVTGQRFVCNTGYKVPECLQQLAILRATLDRYQAEGLGSWTWILVKSADWKAIVRSLRGNTDSPAFTILDKRQTFLEEALFVPVPGRSAELLIIWSLPLNQLLEVSVTHELGHGICQEVDEARADRFGASLRQGKEATCLRSSRGGHSPNGSGHSSGPVRH